MKGQQIVKKTGQVEERTKALRDVRGSNYSALVINKTVERNRMLESIVGVLQE